MNSHTFINVVNRSIFGLLLVAPFLTNSVSAADRPNIVVIMVDDLGYSDLGCYGSEIATPRLDALASQGLRFSQFYNTAKCHSSRVSLLTGQYCIAAGDTAMNHGVTSAEVLGQAGYFTAMTGKSRRVLRTAHMLPMEAMVVPIRTSPMPTNVRSCGLPGSKPGAWSQHQMTSSAAASMFSMW